MKNIENRIDQLFESTRNEVPIRSYASSKAIFIAKLNTTPATGVQAKWAQISFTFKTLIMLGIIGTVATVTTLLVATPTTHEKLEPLEPLPQLEKTEVIDQKNDVIVRTTYFDTEKKWAEISIEPTEVSVSDSSGVEPTEEPKKPLPKVKLEENAAPPIPAEEEDSTKADQKTTLRSFIIKRNTTDVELENIRKLAQKAGLGFHYNVFVWKGKIKHCSIHVKLTKGEGNYCTYDTQLSGKFHKQIQWEEDENGKAIGFSM